MIVRYAFATFLFVLLTAHPALAQTTAVDAGIPDYEKVSGVTGNIASIGSDTLNNLMTLWAEKFESIYPGVTIEIEGKGSSTAPPALISATAALAPMSREMKGSEIDAFRKRFGYEPTAINVAVDTLAVFVHRDNPIKSLSIPQIDAVFSRTRRHGAGEIRTWGDLGLTGEWAGKPVSVYGRNSASGTYGFFKEVVLNGGDFKDSVKEQPGSASVVQSVGADKYSIGYSGIGYKTAGVIAVPIEVEGEGAVEATAANAYSGNYPLARFLIVYINKQPTSRLSRVLEQFLLLVLSKEGQQVVVKDNYYPLPAEILAAERQKVLQE